MKTVFMLLTWLLVTFVEGAVLFFFWRWFIEKSFPQAPHLVFQQMLGVKITASIVFPEPLFRQIERKPGGGSPLMDLALLRMQLVFLVFIVGCFVKLVVDATVPTLEP